MFSFSEHFPNKYFRKRKSVILFHDRSRTCGEDYGMQTVSTAVHSNKNLGFTLVMETRCRRSDIPVQVTL